MESSLIIKALQQMLLGELLKKLDRYENGVLSTLYIVFGIKENNPVDSDFLVSYYSTNLWHKGIHEIAAEGASKSWTFEYLYQQIFLKQG